MRSAHFWLILAIFVVLSIIHYAEQLGIVGTVPPSLHFGLTRHAIERILLLVPIIYAGVKFGLMVGLVTCFVALILMLPRALFISPVPADALLESAGVILTGTLACFWFDSQVKARERQRMAIELKRTQEELQSQIRLSRTNKQRLATIDAISHMLSHSLRVEEVLHSALDMLVEVAEVEVALLFSLDKEAEELRLMAHKGVSDKLVWGLEQIKLGEGFNGQVALTGEPLIVENISRDPELAKQAVGQEKVLAQFIVVPIKARGEILGTLCVANYSPRQFFADDVELLGAIGSQIGIILDNARFYREQRETARLYQGIFANASDAIWVQDLEGRITTANEAAAKLTGYDIETLTRMDVSWFLGPESLSLAREVRHKLLRGEPIAQPYEQRLIRKDGEEAIIKLTTNLITSDGRPVGFQHIARDVTEEMRLQDNMKFYIREVTRAQEEERKRIARELHDETAQSLIVISHQLENFASQNKHLSAGEVELLNCLRKQVNDTLQGVRRFSRDLRPSILDDLGLLPSLEWLIKELEEQYRIKANLKVVGSQRRLAPEAELSLFRILQEALTNVGRHAEASKVDVTLEFAEAKIVATVMDDGKGFELPRTLGELSRSGKLGLAGMEERVRLLGGSLIVQSRLGKGTVVAIKAPV